MNDPYLSILPSINSIYSMRVKISPSLRRSALPHSIYCLHSSPSSFSHHLVHPCLSLLLLLLTIFQVTELEQLLTVQRKSFSDHVSENSKAKEQDATSKHKTVQSCHACMCVHVWWLMISSSFSLDQINSPSCTLVYVYVIYDVDDVHCSFIPTFVS